LETGTDIEIEDINKSNLEDIPEPCGGCVYWESPAEFDQKKLDRRQFQARKREWFEKTTREFGTCGKIVYHDGKPIAYAQYAPRNQLAGAGRHESKQVGKIEEGVIFLSCLYVMNKRYREKGIGEKLLQTIIEDLRRRGYRAIETVARRSEAYNPSGPVLFYVRNGFHVKNNTDPEYPLMRLFL